MDRLEHEVRHTMEQIAAGVDDADAIRVARAANEGVRAGALAPEPQDRLRTRRLVVVVSAATVAAAVAVAFGWIANSSSDSPRSSVASDPVHDGGRGGNSVQRPTPGVPCAGAKHGEPMELAAKAADKGISVYLPESAASRVKDAWTCFGAPQPLYLIDGLQVSYAGGWADLDADRRLAELAAEYGGEVDLINGYPAWIAPASKSQKYNGVLIIRSGTAIQVLAPGDVDIDRLVTLAKSLDLAHAVNTPN